MNTDARANEVTVIGAGLAGSEAAWQLASRGIPVRLLEMRPARMGPAHHTAEVAELVCSNSLKSLDPSTAAGQLKRELSALGSLILSVARDAAVPAGAALAVDRAAFSRGVSHALDESPFIEILREEAVEIPAGEVIIAAGPLVSDALETALSALIGPDRLAFYDAAAPIIDAATIDHSRVFAASRWEKGEGADYLNCPLDRVRYELIVQELQTAQRATAKDFERHELFQACQPVEEIARSGLDALRYGALKPVGLTDPATGKRPWAVAQLRPEGRDCGAYNLVGFQTNLTFGEQRRIIHMIPGLEDAEIVRYGVMHKNTFIDAPRLLTEGLALREHRRIRVAGQISGTEGYLEAAATGVVAALDVWTTRTGAPQPHFPRESVLGALIGYCTDPQTRPYQPMHVNFGLVPPLEGRGLGKRERYAAYADRAQRAMDDALADRPDLAIPAPFHPAAS
ncbi:MAG: methylenetetrahydrofolate--tRNA-(uracil(54)-C(5))-methyltransferase (FADH(2)-oxidizing) TrmFO [Actinobacteria bacterium]|nr:methylenetetrahydrofolate--tRNA-(uracil(54)-C(5))-methyltransferase (FADH(2)-oxidizing) TrmFO [Actinomycetota bacterium]